MNHVLILAGGRGSRMGVDEPKVLTEVAGKPMISRVLESVSEICDCPTLVVGFGAEEVLKRVSGKAKFVMQSEQLGTGHAVSCAKEKLSQENFENILILPGDHPLIRSKTLRDLVASHDISKAVITLGYVQVNEYEGVNEVFYNCGRIIRDEINQIIGIVELKDANEDQKNIKEANVSYYCFDAKWLWENIEKLRNENASREYYLTDLVKVAVDQKQIVNGCLIADSLEGMGVNTPQQKAKIEEILKKRS